MLSRLTASLLQYNGFLILARARRLQKDLGEVERTVVVDITFQVYIWQGTTSYMFIDVLESFLYVLMLSFSRAGPLSKAESNFGSTRVRRPFRSSQFPHIRARQSS